MSKTTRTGKIRVYACIAALAAIGIVLGKLLAINVTEFMRFSLENITIIFTGIVFGPVLGGVIGGLQDLLGCFVAGYVINPIVTLGSISIGVISGLLWRIGERRPAWLRMCLSVGVAHAIGSVIIKTLGLALFYSLPFSITLVWRTLNYAIVGAAEVILLLILLNSKQLLSQINKIHRFSIKPIKQEKGESQDDV